MFDPRQSARAPRDPALVRRVMQRVGSRDTAPEMSLRRELFGRGLRYRLHDASLPGRPDLVLRASQLVVFVDGDFWHGHNWIIRGAVDFESQFSTNREYRITKIRRNMARDERVNEELGRLGWRVIRLWESDIRRDVLAGGELVVDHVKTYCTVGRQRYDPIGARDS